MTSTARATGPVNTGTLAELVAAELDIPEDQARAAVAAVLNNITRSVAAGHPVAVSNFGSWHPVPVAATNRRHPQTGEPIAKEATRRVRFRPAPRFRAAVRAADPTAADIRKKPSH